MLNQDDSWWQRKTRFEKAGLLTIGFWGSVFLFAFLVDPPSELVGDTSPPAMNINIVSIGGWNVWWFIAFWMLSQCILVHHARRK